MSDNFPTLAEQPESNVRERQSRLAGGEVTSQPYPQRFTRRYEYVRISMRDER